VEVRVSKKLPLGDKKIMARRRRTRTVTRYVRRGVRRRRGLLSGKMGNIAIGAIAGIAGDMIPPILGNFTKPVVFGAGGYILKKPALFTLAGYELGRTLNPFGNSGGGLFKGQGD